MGQIWSSFILQFERLFNKKEARIACIGLDAAGKTTILYKIKLSETLTTIPTIGFNVETFKYGRAVIQMWDLGGQEKIRPLWKHYIQNCNAIIYVVDANDRERYEEAQRELFCIMEDQAVADARLLVFANKVDLPNCCSPNEMVNILCLRQLKQKWYVQPCCGIRGDGLYDGLEWLINSIP